MHIYYKNFNLNSNHILTKCLMHLKIGREYDTKLFGEDSTSLEEKIDPLSIGSILVEVGVNLLKLTKRGSIPQRSGIDRCCKFKEGSILKALGINPWITRNLKTKTFRADRKSVV